MRINTRNLSKLDPRIQIPRYDREKASQSFMHIGVGGFHRAHQALHADDLLHSGGDPARGYCGVAPLLYGKAEIW